MTIFHPPIFLSPRLKIPQLEVTQFWRIRLHFTAYISRILTEFEMTAMNLTYASPVWLNSTLVPSAGQILALILPNSLSNKKLNSLSGPTSAKQRVPSPLACFPETRRRLQVAINLGAPSWLPQINGLPEVLERNFWTRQVWADGLGSLT